jgi:hypothetical protein
VEVSLKRLRRQIFMNSVYQESQLVIENESLAKVVPNRRKCDVASVLAYDQVSHISSSCNS